MGKCCGGISPNNKDVKKDTMPYMTERCYSKNEWDIDRCDINCCDSESYCIPTEQGGFCYNGKKNEYYRYRSGGMIDENGMRDSTNQRENLAEIGARKQYPYFGESEFPYTHNESIKHLMEGEYFIWDNFPEREIVNRKVENSIRDEETDYKKSTEYLVDPRFTPITNVIIIIILITIVIALINNIVVTNKIDKYRRLFF